MSGSDGSLTPVDAHSGRCLLAPAREQRLGAVGGELLLEDLVGQLGVGDAGLALQRDRLVGADGVEALVDLGVDARHEEGGDRVDGREVDARGLGLLEAGEVGVDDGAGDARG